jgi:hypothetical protein
LRSVGAQVNGRDGKSCCGHLKNSLGSCLFGAKDLSLTLLVLYHRRTHVWGGGMSVFKLAIAGLEGGEVGLGFEPDIVELGG